MGVWRRVARVALLLIQVLAGAVVMMALYMALIFGPAIMATGSWPPLAFSSGEQVAALVIVGLAVAIAAGKVAAVSARRKEKQREAGVAAESKRQADEQRKNQREKQEEENRKRAETEARQQGEGQRKRALAREWVQVMSRWRSQDQKGQPRNPTVMALMERQRERAQKESNPEVKAWLTGNIEQLQRQPNWIRPVTPICPQKEEVNAGAHEAKQTAPVSIEERIRELAEIARTAFQVKSCPRCYENKMALTGITSKARSIRYACAECKKEQRAVAISPDSQKGQRPGRDHCR